jgi:transcriptional regulator with XRE-family HTH domain
MIDDVKKLLGDNIRSQRVERQISQEELASLAGLHRTYIGGAERGERNVSLVNIVAIARALGSTPSELLEGIP